MSAFTNGWKKLTEELAELEAAIEAEQSGFGSDAMETEELSARLEQMEQSITKTREELSSLGAEAERAAGERICWPSELP